MPMDVFCVFGARRFHDRHKNLLELEVGRVEDRTRVRLPYYCFNC